MEKTKKYGLILADPPWKQSRGGKKNVRPNSSGKEIPYVVQDLNTIKEILKGFVEKTEENSVY